MGRETTQNDVVFETILQYFEGLVRPEAVANQRPWFLVSTLPSFRVKDTLEPLQADLGVGISRFGARILPSGGGKGCPVASMGRSRPNNHGIQIPTITTYTFDRSDHRALDTRASVVSHVVLTYKDFDRAWHGEHDSSLVHVVQILCQDIWIL